MSKNYYFPSDYEEFIYKSRYARWNGERREEWPETVDRYFDCLLASVKEKHGYTLKPTVEEELRAAVLNMDVVPSMRALMTAGDALNRDNTAGYNCAYLAVDDPKAFDDVLFTVAFFFSKAVSPL